MTKTELKSRGHCKDAFEIVEGPGEVPIPFGIISSTLAKTGERKNKIDECTQKALLRLCCSVNGIARSFLPRTMKKAFFGI